MLYVLAEAPLTKWKQIMFHNINIQGGNHRVCEVDNDYHYSGGAAKRVRELGGGDCRLTRFF